MGNCKYCKSDDVEHLEEQNIVKYKGKNVSFFVEYSICNACKHEFVSKHQIISNDARLRDAKKIMDGLMSSTEIYKARTKLNLTQEQASLVFGGGKNAFSKYERAEVSQSVAMDKLIRVALRSPSVYRELLEDAGINQPNMTVSS